MDTTCCLCGQESAFPLVGSGEPARPDLQQYRLCERCYPIKTAAFRDDLQSIQLVVSMTQRADPAVRAYFDAAFGADPIQYMQALAQRQAGEQAALAQQQIQQFEQQTQQAADTAARWNSLATMVTSGHDFQGYKIKAYQGFISAKTVFGMGMFSGLSASVSNLTGNESDRFTNKLEETEAVVLGRLRQRALELGGNAIIGLDLDYTLFAQALLGVIASGTSVLIVPADTVAA